MSGHEHESVHEVVCVVGLPRLEELDDPHDVHRRLLPKHPVREDVVQDQSAECHPSQVQQLHVAISNSI